jgi:hypothetical protein
MTHPGVGVLTALAVVNTLEPFNRFANQRRSWLTSVLNRWNARALKGNAISESARPVRDC